MDLLAACEDHITLQPGMRALIPTGLCVEIPSGYEGQVRARSGLALKQGLGIPNGPGTIDSDYRGEVGVLLINWGDEPQTIRRGDRIAQLVLAPVVRAAWIETERLEGTPRGSGGFGHSGR
jgi:dUTP pyrophosphatase